MRTAEEKTIDALKEQLELTRQHIARLKDKQARYRSGTLTRALVGMEAALWEELQVILLAVYAGKTVQPS